MRIAISGSFGVGKTTLSKELFQSLKAKYPNKKIALIDSIDRDLIREKCVSYDKKSAPEDYFIYVAEYVKRLISIKYDILVQDRTLLDVLAYAIANKNISDNFLEMMYQLVEWYTKDVDFYFYIPIEFQIEDDGIRTTDLEYQKMIDRLVKYYLDYFRMPYKTLSGNVDERLEQALSTVELYEKS